MQNRKQEFDIARGIGITAVVFSHNGDLVGKSLIYPYFIALFFVIAGYFYHNNSVSRALKLVWTYCRYTLVLFAMSLITQTDQWVHNLLGAFYGRGALYPMYIEPNINFLTMSNHPLWFLPAMSLTTLLFGELMPKLDTVKKKVVVLVILTLISWGFTYLPILLPWSLDTISAFTIFMLVGYWLKEYSVFPRFYHSKYKGVLFGMMGILYIILEKTNRMINMSGREYGMNAIGGGRNGLPNVIMCVLIGVIGSFLCIVVCNIVKNTFIGKLFAIIGQHTIPVLGLHVFLYKIVEKMFCVPDQTGHLWSWGVMYLINMVIITVCVLGDILVKKSLGRRCGLENEG